MRCGLSRLSTNYEDHTQLLCIGCYVWLIFQLAGGRQLTMQPFCDGSDQLWRKVAERTMRRTADLHLNPLGGLDERRDHSPVLRTGVGARKG